MPRQALGEELRKGEKVLEEVKFIGTALKEEDTSVDYGAELGLLLDTFSIIADSVSTKTVLFYTTIQIIFTIHINHLLFNFILT